MSQIHIQRHHELGLPTARQAALLWAEKAQEKFAMACRYEEGSAQDIVYFEGPGIEGTMVVQAGQFELHACLGFLLSAFQQQIEAKLNRQFDKLLHG